jgi:hypothetical protein
MLLDLLYHKTEECLKVKIVHIIKYFMTALFSSFFSYENIFNFRLKVLFLLRDNQGYLLIEFLTFMKNVVA